TDGKRVVQNFFGPAREIPPIPFTERRFSRIIAYNQRDLSYDKIPQTERQERRRDMALDTASATPLFQQLAEELRQAIRTGEYPAGSQLPTEHQLCDRYQVSRVTVRKALEELSQRGEVIRRPGKGTFVANKKFQRDLTSVLSFTEMCRH